MMRLLFGLVLISILSCGPHRQFRSGNEALLLPAVEVVPDSIVLRSSATRFFDLAHMELHVAVNWEMRQIHGKARLVLHPYFYATDLLRLDAVEMEIIAVNLKREDALKPLDYQYNQKTLEIHLDRIYTRHESVEVVVEYKSASEEEFNSDENRGLFFINSDRKNPYTPVQCWTQGEAQNNSRWFPTIDAPNERFTHDLYIRVDDQFKTLSNGSLIYSNFDADGTRTDYWQQSKAHAPYLVMLAVGDWVVAMDEWEREKEPPLLVNYYLEPAYAQYAYSIFGRTPEMLGYFSSMLDYSFPWEKYSQVVVRDFVSGAMENTGAVVFGDFMFQTPRELLDENYEFIIAHELFHHWFGNLVTCEDWSNLALNESFASYSECLWLDYKYGPDTADYHRQQSMQEYFEEAKVQVNSLIRYDYPHPDDMFDAHSYNKGAAILHMLRRMVGDDAFFLTLQTYLKERAFKDAEFDHFRLALEEVTGVDYQWFFKQWFLGDGHPKIQIDYFYDSLAREQQILIKQTQDVDDGGVFRLPVEFEVQWTDSLVHYQTEMRESELLIRLPNVAPPICVRVDPKATWLAEVEDHFPLEWILPMLSPDQPYACRKKAAEAAIKCEKAERIPWLKILAADDFWDLRYSLLSDPWMLEASGKEILKHMAYFDPYPKLRAEAIAILSGLPEGDEHMDCYYAAIEDPSYTVVAAGLDALALFDLEASKAAAKKLWSEPGRKMKVYLASFYAQYGSDEDSKFFYEHVPTMYGDDLYDMADYFLNFLEGKSEDTFERALPLMVSWIENQKGWWMRALGFQGLYQVTEELRLREEGYARALKKCYPDREEGRCQMLEAKHEKAATLREGYRQKFIRLMAIESSEEVKEIFGF